MFHFELTKTIDGKQVTTLGQQWDTRRDAAFHAMLVHKLALADMETLRDKPDHGGISHDGGRLAIVGRDTTPAKPLELGVWDIHPGYSDRVKCRYCASSWAGAGPFLKQLLRQDGNGLKCTYTDCPSNQPVFNRNQPPTPQPSPPASRPILPPRNVSIADILQSTAAATTYQWTPFDIQTTAVDPAYPAPEPPITDPDVF